MTNVLPCLPEYVMLTRDSRGMSHAEAAQACEISATRLREIEEGGREATPAEIRRLADGLGYPISAFLREYEPPALPIMCRKHFTEEEFDLADEPYLRARLRRMVETLPARRLREAHDDLLAIYKDEQAVQKSDEVAP